MNKRQVEKQKEKTSTARRRAETHQTGYERTTMNLPEGTKLFLPKKPKVYRLDIIPYKAGEGNKFADEGELHFERTYYSHRGVGADDNSYICSKKTFNKPCPICDDRAKMANSADADEDIIKELGPKERQLWHIIDLDEKDKGVQLWDISFHLFGKFLDNKVRNGDDGEYDEFYFLKGGKTLKIGAEEKSFGGRSFLEFNDIEFKDRKAPYTKEILESTLCLDDILKEMKYDELKKIYLQTQDDAEDEDKPKKGKSKTKDKDEDDDDSDDDEDEDEKPSKKKAKKAKKEEPEDDDDDSDDDADDDSDDDDDDDDEKQATAKDKGIKKGSKVKSKKLGECEVVKISPDGTSITIKDEDDETHKVGAADIDLVSDDEEDEEDEKPSKPKKGKKKEDEDDDDDEEDEDEEDDDEEDEKPAKKKGAKAKPKKKKDEEEEDEDEWDDDEPSGDDDDDDEDDEEEEKPKKKTKKK